MKTPEQLALYALGINEAALLLANEEGKDAYRKCVAMFTSVLADAKANGLGEGFCEGVEAAAVVVEDCEGDALPMEKIAARVRALKGAV